jgi:hypothetical protein
MDDTIDRFEALVAELPLPVDDGDFVELLVCFGRFDELLERRYLAIDAADWLRFEPEGTTGARFERAQLDTAARIAHVRRIRSLPWTFAEWTRGTLSHDQVDVIADGLDPGDVDFFARREAGIVAHLAALPLGELRHAVRGLRSCARSFRELARGLAPLS